MSHAPPGLRRFNTREPPGAPSPVNPAVVGIALTPPCMGAGGTVDEQRADEGTNTAPIVPDRPGAVKRYPSRVLREPPRAPRGGCRRRGRGPPRPPIGGREARR